MPLVIKINVRHTENGSPIKVLRLFDNYTLNLRHNSLGSSFRFDFLFDPSNKEHAEMFCVSHVHECQLYYTANEDPLYKVVDSDLALTGYLMVNEFVSNAKPTLVSVSGYSRPAVLNDCDIPSGFNGEIDGLTFRQIIANLTSKFKIGLVVDKAAVDANRVYKEYDKGDVDDTIQKTTPEVNQNIAAYLSEIAKSRNIVLSHTPKGEIWVTTAKTKTDPILVFDYSTATDVKTGKKIPGVEAKLKFDAQPLHTHIRVKMQADDEEGKNTPDIEIRNPLLPLNTIFRPKTHVVSFGDEFTVKQAASYELSKEIRDAVNLTIDVGTIEAGGKLITPNNSILIRDPKLFLYNQSRWYVQGVDIVCETKKSTATLHCVLPFAYNFEKEELVNVFVDAHKNLPRV
jgi:prophage tail gpP-like protein